MIWPTGIAAPLGRFIVFEGLDGAGTTTQARLLADALSQTHEVMLTAEPTDGPVGQLIRDVIAGEGRVTPGTLAFLFAADRHEHLYHPTDGILAQLDNGRVVVCDRYLFSSLAYQGTLHDREHVEVLNGRFPLPGHVIFIDTPVGIAEGRLANRAVRDSLEKPSVQVQVELAYREVIGALEAGSACHLTRVDGSLSPHAIHSEILAAITSHGL